jgi:hypothetical protein
MKWLIHVGNMVIQKEIPKIDPRYGSPIQDVEYHHQIHDMSLHERIYPNDQFASQ